MAEKTEAEVLQDSRVVSALCERLNADLVGFEQWRDDRSITDAVFRCRSSGGLICVEAKKALSLELVGQLASASTSGHFTRCYGLVTHRCSKSGVSCYRSRVDPVRVSRVARALSFEILCVSENCGILSMVDDVSPYGDRSTPSESRSGVFYSGGRKAMRPEHLRILRTASERGYITVDDIPDSLITPDALARERGRYGHLSDSAAMRSAKSSYLYRRFMYGNMTKDGGYMVRDKSINTGCRLAAYVLTDIGVKAVEERSHCVI
jgi:hypothetical protein